MGTPLGATRGRKSTEKLAGVSREAPDIRGRLHGGDADGAIGTARGTLPGRTATRHRVGLHILYVSHNVFGTLSLRGPIFH